MKLSRLLQSIAVTGAAVAAIPAADSYQLEASLGYASSSTDQTNVDSTSFYLDGSYYFKPVAVGDAPHEEADFLGHHSYIAGYGTMPWQASGRQLVSRDRIKADPIDADGFTYGVSGQFAHNECPVTFGAGVQLGSIKDKAPVDVEFKPVNWTVNAGYWVLPNLVGGLRYTSEELKTTTSGVSTKEKTHAIEAFGKLVHRFANDQSINAEATAGRQKNKNGTTDLDSWIGLAALDWYPVSRYGIGVVVSGLRGENDADEGMTYGVRASGWFTDQVGLRAGFEQFKARNDTVSEDIRSWYVELAARF